MANKTINQLTEATTAADTDELEIQLSAGGASRRITKENLLQDTAPSDHIHTASEVSDFVTEVRANRLDQMAVPTASVSANSQKITNLGTPTTGTDATNKTYVDNAITAGGGYTDEAAQDAVGAMIADTSTLNLTYTDATPELKGDVLDSPLLQGQNSAYHLSVDNHVTGTTNKLFTATLKTKVDGIATAATANDTDANLKARANHTGTQLASTISDFSAAADARITNFVGAAPAALDTLDELAAALGDDANFATTVTNSLATKSPKIYDAVVATSGGDYTSITAALAASKKSIFVRNGTYTEAGNLAVIAGVRIVGENRDNVIINLSSTYGFDITGEGIQLENFTITAWGTTGAIYNTGGNATEPYIHNIRFTATSTRYDYAIRMDRLLRADIDHIIYRNDTATVTAVAIGSVSAAATGKLHHSYLYGNIQGFYKAARDDLIEISSNWMQTTWSSTATVHAIELTHASLNFHDTHITNNYICLDGTNHRAIRVDTADNITITGNNIQVNSTSGIAIDIVGSDHNFIDGNFVISGDIAIKIGAGSTGNLVGSNKSKATTYLSDAGTSTVVGVDNSTAATLTNKTIALGSNTVSGSVAEFNTALTGADFYTSGGTDVPIADGGTGASTKAAAFDALSPMTTAGDLITGGASGTGTRLAMGSSLQQVRVNAGGTALEYFTASAGGGQTLFESIVAPSGGDYTTLGAAITAGKTRIFIRNGTYVEAGNITIPASSVIVAESREAVIDLANTYRLNMGGADISLVGFTYTKWGSSGGLGPTSGTTTCERPFIHNVVARYTTSQTNMNKAMDIGGMKNGEISSCFFVNNTASTNATGGIFTSSTGTPYRMLITNNKFVKNGSNGFTYCIDISANNSGYLTISDNIFDCTVTTATSAAIYFSATNVSQCVIKGNIFHTDANNCRFLYLGGSGNSDNTITNNQIAGDGSNGIGILIDNGSYNLIQGNTIYAKEAVKLTASTSISNRVTDNILWNSAGKVYATDSGTGTVFRNNTSNRTANNALNEEKDFQQMQNTSAGTLTAGSVVTYKATVTTTGDVTTTTTVGDPLVFGVASTALNINTYGPVQTHGKVTNLRGDGTTDIAIGDFLTTSATAGVCQKAVTGDTVFAIAQEAYATNDTNGSLDALLIPPRKI